MICKYCGTATDNKDGVCDRCKRRNGNNDSSQFEDIFSSSEKEIEGVANEILFKDTEDNPEFALDKGKNDSGRKSKRTKRITVGIAICFIVAALSVICYSMGLFSSSASKIEDCLAAGKYEEAYSIFAKEYDTSGSGSLNKMLNKRIEYSYNQYCLGKREYESVKEELGIIKKMNVEAVAPKAKEYLKKLDEVKASKKAYNDAEKQYSSNQYAAAITNYKKVVKDDENYSSAVSKLEQAILNYRNTALSEAATSVSEGDYNSAIKTLETALVILEKDDVVEKRIREYKKSASTKSRQEIIDTADKYVYRNEYALAAKTVKDAMENNEALKDDETLKNALNGYLERLRESLSADIDSIIASGDYSDAGSTLKEAQDLLGKDDAVIVENKAKLIGKIPVYLDELEPSSSEEWKYNSGVAVDSFGTDRSKEDNYIILNTKSSATYVLPSGYNTFKCMVAASKNIDSAVKCRIRITASVGGEYFYRESEISAAAEAQELSLNISKCTSVTVSVSGEGANIIMYNAQLKK